MPRTICSPIIAAISMLLVVPALGEESQSEAPLDAAQLETDGVVIGEIVLDKRQIFNVSDPKENNALYRLANKLHIVTRDEVIEKQLLLQPGNTYSARLVSESERILRANNYLYDAKIAAINRRDGAVDLRVTTRDVWTLKPSLSVSRRGGENKTAFGIEELNLLGRGQTLRIERIEDVDRTSKFVQFEDAHLGRSWVSTNVLVSDNSDGHSRLLSLIRPFYALDTRWSAGVTAYDDDRRSALYDLGNETAEYRRDRTQFSAFAGWSAGLREGWVRRYTAGIVFDDSRFAAVTDGTLPAVIPADRELNYPFFGVELVQDRFETTRNREQIGRTEDFFTGTRITATLGWADEGIGADRDAFLYTANYNRGFGSLDSAALLISAWASGRQESSDAKNVLAGFDARYYLQQSNQRVFYATVSGSYGHDLDLDNLIELGGDSGLRGYPLRYQTGESKLLITVEQRYFWNWYPFRLFRVGGAIFADAGRTWGDNPVGGEPLGWLRDVGFGLRLASTRTGSRKMVHIDIAFPLDADASIDDVQFLLESKKSF